MKHRLLTLLVLLFVVNTGYISAFATPSIFYMANVVFHLAAGVALMAIAVTMWRTHRAAAIFFLCGIPGLYLAIMGATRQHNVILWLHIALGAAALVAGMLAFPKWRALQVAVAAAVLLQTFRWIAPPVTIANPKVVPISMEEEGAGPKSPFWPSSANTNVNGIIPANFFMDSKLCGECHKDIYEQWSSSMHHFASFNNQFYRKSIEYMQDHAGTKPTKWCAGCHDHAVFFNGRFDRPIKEQVDTPEAQNGLGCLSCHSIVHVNGTMGNGGFTVEYPPLHELASSHNPIIRKLDDYLTYLNPKPHRAIFLKPFMQGESSSFCSTCHKVHLDVPVNNYRWLRGFNDYDNWQASGVSGQGARSFYYPQKSSSCADCHMPLVASHDPGNRDGQIHSHRFPAANMAVPVANHDQTQMAAVEKFLTSGFITVDVFAASPADRAQTEMRRRNAALPQLMSTFAVGEEAEQSGAVAIREVGKIAAPIDTAHAKFAPGSTIRLDAVVRTRKIGHFFPGGTVDAFDVWLELKACDATGRTIFWSGKVDDNGHGPVEPGAHFYRSYQLDADGNMINKRNAFEARSVLYVRLIPPGAADVVHYRVNIPKDAQGPITVTARLNYRKFAHYYTHFAYENAPNVSGPTKTVPDLPIVTVAEKTTTFGLGDTDWKPVVQKLDRERWNDWGIGMLLQGDLKGAEYAFQRVTEAEPSYADGWLNVARALIQEGETDAAKTYLQKADSLDSSLARIHFFKAMVQKADGDYDGAIASLRHVLNQYPRDRVVWDQLGRVLFLQRKYPDAIAALEKTLEVDPEDLQAHYTLMLAWRGVGDTEKAAREEKLFRRFKADEASQAITARPRLETAEDNNERQSIHDHESVSPLDAHR
jgi:tetratricopeptide (TPR) repeat protein